MLIRFSVENFLSFKDRITFSMLPGKGMLKKEHKADAVNGVRVLKTSVVFGANASGKSNLIKAMAFGKRMIIEGTPSNMPIEYNKFRLDVECLNKPSRIEYEIQVSNKNYAYGFVFNNELILEEWLYEISKKGEVKIYERIQQDNIFDINYLLKQQDKEEERQFLNFLCKATPNNQLFLHEILTRKVKSNVTNIRDLELVLSWFITTLTIIFPSDKYKQGIKLMAADNDKLKLYYSGLLRYFDTGIETICLQAVKEDKQTIPSELLERIKMDLLKQDDENSRVLLTNQRDSYIISLDKKSKGSERLKLKVQKFMTQHAVSGDSKNAYFDIADESDGTNRIIDYIPLIIDLIKGNKVFLVDEMERSLHPNLIYDIFDIFLSNCDGVNSQLIVSTHESSLLTQKLLRKDEIWFIVKDVRGVSHIHSLEDYNIRFDKEIRKDYLLGRYRGVPRLGDRQNLDSLFDIKE